MKTKKLKPITRHERDAQRLKKNGLRAHSLLPDQPPADVDAMRMMMARRIAIFIGNRRRAWRRCPQPCCRRTRGCLAPEISCSNARVLPPMSPERATAVKAHFFRALKREMARREARQGEAE